MGKHNILKTDDKPSFVTRDGMASDKDYIQWLADVKQRIKSVQSKVSIKVNTAMLRLYWSIGRDLVNLHPEDKWGAGIVKQFALDLRNSFPNETGFSDTNIKYMKRWYDFYYQRITISHQAGDQIEMPDDFGKIPWKHHVAIFTKSSSVEEALFYIRQTIEGNWSRSVLESEIEGKLYKTHGEALTNFEKQLPIPQGQLAQEILKDPYNFDFLTMKGNFDEKELEDALVSNITRFLLELGKGFAFVGRQMELRMPDGESYFPDLVFYHIKLKCYIVIDLKAVAFKPEFAGKINFYISAADELLRGDDDNPTIGLILCKESNKTVVEWTLRGIERPLGVATYQLQEVVDRTFAELENKNADYGSTAAEIEVVEGK